MPKFAELQGLQGTFGVRGFPLVEFDRKPIDKAILRGFVLGWNDALTLLQVIEDHKFGLNGYAVLQNRDVRRWRGVTADEFVAKAARLKRLKPVAPTGISIENWRTTFDSAGSKFPLITIHEERLKRGCCDIGKLIRTSQRGVTIRKIDSRARWEDPGTYSFRNVTLVEFGGAYEDLLIRLAED